MCLTERFSQSNRRPPVHKSAACATSCRARHYMEMSSGTGRDNGLQHAKLIDQALSCSAAGGQLESVKVLLQIDHIYSDDTIEVVLNSAAQANKWTCVREVLQFARNDKANGSQRSLDLANLFYLAATSRDDQLEALNQVLQFANYRLPESVRDYSLYQAIVLQKEKTVFWLLENCHASANATDLRPMSITCDDYIHVHASYFRNALNAAASAGNLLLTRRLIEAGATIGGGEDCALQLAASAGRTEIVKLLLEAGSPVDRVLQRNLDLGFDNGTALQAACDNNHAAIVEALIAAGADPNLGAGPFTNPITAATHKADGMILRLLLGSPLIDVNVVGGLDQSSPLLNAVTYMSLESVVMLLEKGAEIDVKNAAGDTPLIMAAWKGSRACVDLLCAHGADVTCYSPSKGLPTQAAAAQSHTIVADVLAERMGLKVAELREKLNFDASKEALKEAQSKIQEQETHIRELELLVANTAEQLAAVKKEINLLHNERDRQAQTLDLEGESSSNLSGQLYTSTEATDPTLKDRRDLIADQIRTPKVFNDLPDEHADEEKQKLTSLNEAIEQSPAYVERSRELIRAYATEKVALERLSFERKRVNTLEKENALLKRSLTELSAGSSLPAQDVASVQISPVDHAELQEKVVQIKPSASQQRRKEAEVRLEAQYTTSGKAIRDSWIMETDENARGQIAREAWALKLQEQATASTTAVHLRDYIENTSPPARSETTLSDETENNDRAHVRTLSYNSEANRSSEGITSDDRLPFRRSAYLDARGHRNSDGSVGGYRNGRGARLKRPMNPHADSSEGIEYVPERSRAFSGGR